MQWPQRIALRSPPWLNFAKGPAGCGRPSFSTERGKANRRPSGDQRGLVSRVPPVIARGGSAVWTATSDPGLGPERGPGKAGDTKPAQSTERVIGPYEMQDFNLYYILRYGFAPSKVAFLSYSAWSKRDAGTWPDAPHATCNEYGLADIKRYLGIFLHRFFKTSQFKRSCVPNGPKVGNGGSLSPRGDWRAPSDSEATVWMNDLSNIPD